MLVCLVMIEIIPNPEINLESSGQRAGSLWKQSYAVRFRQEIRPAAVPYK